MIEVDMTVNELTEDVNMEAGQILKTDIKNPIVKIKLVNNRSKGYFPPRFAVYGTYRIDDNNIDYLKVIADPSSTKDTETLSLFGGYEYGYYIKAPESSDVIDVEIDNIVNLDVRGNGELVVIDPTKEASVTFNYWDVE